MRIAPGDAPITRRRMMGLAAGSLWLVVVSAVFEIWALVAIGTPTATGLLVAAIVAMSVVVGFGVMVTRAATRMPIEPPNRQERRLAKRFGWIVAAEILAWLVVTSWAVANKRYALLPALDLIIVGLHFFPLAALFHVPRYHVMALFFCTIPAATLVLFSEASLIGHAQAWYVLPSIGCGWAATVTAAASVKEAWDSIPRAVMSVAR